MHLKQKIIRIEKINTIFSHKPLQNSKSKIFFPSINNKKEVGNLSKVSKNNLFMFRG